jgi:hypothetical protein
MTATHGIRTTDNTEAYLILTPQNLYFKELSPLLYSQQLI